MTRTGTPVVLVVEDDPSVREMLQDVLLESNYEVVAVADGMTALHLMGTLQADLVTLDLDLPGLSGSELLRTVHERLESVPPVIVITSMAPVKRTIQEQAEAVLAKPFDVEHLIAKVRDALASTARPPTTVTAVSQEQVHDRADFV